MPGKMTCRLTFELGDEGLARNVAASLGPDNEGFVRTRIEGGTLFLDIEAASVQSMLHTVEDLLACMSVAMKASE